MRAGFNRQPMRREQKIVAIGVASGVASMVIAVWLLAALLERDYLQVLRACAIAFIAARLVFWMGYRIHPPYRAPGMSATAYLNLGMILYVLYALAFRARQTSARAAAVASKRPPRAAAHPRGTAASRSDLGLMAGNSEYPPTSHL